MNALRECTKVICELILENPPEEHVFADAREKDQRINLKNSKDGLAISEYTLKYSKEYTLMTIQHVPPNKILQIQHYENMKNALQKYANQKRRLYSIEQGYL